MPLSTLALFVVVSVPNLRSGSLPYFHSNLYWPPAFSDFMNQVDKIGRRILRSWTDQVIVLNHEPIRHFHFVNSAMLNAIDERIGVSSMPGWGANGFEE